MGKRTLEQLKKVTDLNLNLYSKRPIELNVDGIEFKALNEDIKSPVAKRNISFVILNNLYSANLYPINIMNFIKKVIEIDNAHCNNNIRSLIKQITGIITKAERKSQKVMEPPFKINFRATESIGRKILCDAGNRIIKIIENKYPDIVKNNPQLSIGERLAIARDTKILIPDDYYALQYYLFAWVLEHCNFEVMVGRLELDKIYIAIHTCRLMKMMEIYKPELSIDQELWNRKFYFGMKAFESFKNLLEDESPLINEASVLINDFLDSDYIPKFNRAPGKRSSSEDNNVFLLMLRLKAIQQGYVFISCPLVISWLEGISTSKEIVDASFNFFSFFDKCKSYVRKYQAMTWWDSEKIDVCCHGKYERKNCGMYKIGDINEGRYIDVKMMKKFIKKRLYADISESVQNTMFKELECSDYIYIDEGDGHIYIHKHEGVPVCVGREYYRDVYGVNFKNSNFEPLDFEILDNINYERRYCDFFIKIKIQEKLSYELLAYVLGITDWTCIGDVVQTQYSRKIREMFSKTKGRMTAKQDIIAAINKRWSYYHHFVNYKENNGTYYSESIAHPLESIGFLISRVDCKIVGDDYKRFEKKHGGLEYILKILKNHQVREFDYNYFKMFSEALDDGSYKLFYWYRVPIQNVLKLIVNLTQFKDEFEKDMYRGMFYLEQNTAKMIGVKDRKNPEFGHRLYAFISKKPSDIN